MAGYSSTPLPQKLGIKDGSKVAVLGGPRGFSDSLGAATRLGKTLLDVIIVFVTKKADLADRIAAARKVMQPAAGLWIAWPKKSSKLETDITENVVRDIALANALVDNKVAAITEIWSGLQLVIRVKDRLP